MGLKFDATNYGNYSARPLGAGLSAWTALIWLFVELDPGNDLYGIVGDHKLTSSNEGHLFWYDGRSGADKFRSNMNDGTDGGSASINSADGAVAEGSWYSLITTWERNGNSTLYINNVEVPASPNTTTDNNFNRGIVTFTVGRRPNTSSAFLNAGDIIAESAYWGRVFSRGEIAALAKGYSPSFFPNGALWHVPYRNLADTTDRITGATMTEVGAGALTTGDHPQIILPAPMAIITVPAAGDTDTLLANDVESASEVGTPAISQTHVLTATSVESASETSAPVVGQEHALLADDVESASEVSAPVVGQEHVLLADDAESASETSSPAVGQEHALLADDVESASEVSAPAVSESNILLADDVESASEVSVPSVGQEHALLADNAESSSEVTSPTMAQIHALIADSIEISSELSAPVLVDLGGDDILLADDVESASEVTSPTVGQEHALLADDAESASEVTAPTMAQIHALIAGSIEIASEVSTPTVTAGAAVVSTPIEILGIRPLTITVKGVRDV